MVLLPLGMVGQILPDTAGAPLDSNARNRALAEAVRQHMAVAAQHEPATALFPIYAARLDSIGKLLGIEQLLPKERVLALVLERKFDAAVKAATDSTIITHWDGLQSTGYTRPDLQGLTDSLKARYYRDSSAVLRDLALGNAPEDSKAYLRLVLYCLEIRSFRGRMFSPDFEPDRRFLTAYPNSSYAKTILRNSFYYDRADYGGYGFGLWLGAIGPNRSATQILTPGIALGTYLEISSRRLSFIPVIQWGRAGMRQTLHYRSVTWIDTIPAAARSIRMDLGYTLLDLGWCRIMPVGGFGLSRIAPRRNEYRHHRELGAYISKKPEVAAGVHVNFWFGRQYRPGARLPDAYTENSITLQLRYLYTYAPGKNPYLGGPLAWHSITIGLGLIDKVRRSGYPRGTTGPSRRTAEWNEIGYRRSRGVR